MWPSKGYWAFMAHKQMAQQVSNRGQVAWFMAKMAQQLSSGKWQVWYGMAERIHYMAKSMWTPYPTSHSKIMGINMELVPLLLL